MTFDWKIITKAIHENDTQTLWSHVTRYNVDTTKDDDDTTLLMYATSNRRPKIALELLDIGAHPLRCNQEGKSALSEAIWGVTLYYQKHDLVKAYWEHFWTVYKFQNDFMYSWATHTDMDPFKDSEMFYSVISIICQDCKIAQEIFGFDNKARIECDNACDYSIVSCTTQERGVYRKLVERNAPADDWLSLFRLQKLYEFQFCLPDQ